MKNAYVPVFVLLNRLVQILRFTLVNCFCKYISKDILYN